MDRKRQTAIDALEDALDFVDRWRAHAVSRDRNAKELHGFFRNKIRECLREAEYELDRMTWRTK